MSSPCPFCTHLSLIFLVQRVVGRGGFSQALIASPNPPPTQTGFVFRGTGGGGFFPGPHRFPKPPPTQTGFVLRGAGGGQKKTRLAPFFPLPLSLFTDRTTKKVSKTCCYPRFHFTPLSSGESTATQLRLGFSTVSTWIKKQGLFFPRSR